MDEEIKEVGEMATIEDEEEITIEEDYTTLEAETIIIDDDSNIQTDVEYEQAVTQKELADEAREALSAVLLSVLEKGEINDDDIAEIAAQQEKYTENVTALKILGLTTEDEKSTAGKSTTNIITSNMDYNELIKVLSEKADWLYIDEDGQVMLNGEVVPKLKVVELEAEKIKADVGEFKNLTAENFAATNANITNLQADYGEFKTLTAQNFTATNGNITNLTSDVAHIGTLIGGNASIKDIQSLILTSKNTTIENALIKDAMIDTLSANKINAGILNTNNVLIRSEDGSMLLQGNLQQFKDKNGKVRIQIGKDATGDFTFALYDSTGKGQLINKDGIKSSNALADGIIVDAKIANNANISGGKIDMSSLFTTMNNSGYTLKSSKVKFDDKNQTLDVLFNSMNNTLENTVSTVSSHTTSISTQQEKIEQLIADTTIENNGTTTTLKTAFNSVKDTVDSHTQTINYHESTLNSVTAKQTEFKQSLDGFETTVSKTYATNDRVGGVENRVSTVEQTASSLTSKFTNGFNIGIIEQNVEGIKVKHTSIDSNSYTHMSPTGFYLKNKGKDILICDSNGLSYEGTITGSTIKGSIFKSGTDYNPNKQNITGLQIQDDTIHSYGTKNNGMYAVTKISGGIISIGNGADGAGLNWSTHISSSDISLFKQGGTGYFYVGTTNAPGSGYSTTTTTIDTTTINIGSKDVTTAFKVDYNDHCEFGNNYFTRGSLTINQLSQGAAKGTQTYLSGTTISATNIYQNGSSVSGSDIILKDNIKEYKDSALDIINQTKVYSFNRILANQDKTEIGFLAQQVPDIFVFDKGEFTAEELEGLTAQEKQQLLDKKTKEHRTVSENKKLDEIADKVASFYDLNDEQTEEQISQIMDEYRNIEYEVPISTINQNNIIAIMFKAIQELSKKVDELSK